MMIIKSTIAKLLRVDEDMVRRAWSTARAVDVAETEAPKEFATGKEALVFALAYFIGKQPVGFFFGSLGLVAFMCYEAWKSPLLFLASALIVTGVGFLTSRVTRRHG